MGVGMGAAMAIGAAFGGKWQGGRGGCGAQMGQHMRNHRIALNNQPVGLDLAGRVAVANMPCQPRQGRACDQQHLLCGGAHHHMGAIGQGQDIALIQRCCLRQIYQKRATLIGDQPLAAQKPRVVIQCHALGICGRSAALLHRLGNGQVVGKIVHFGPLRTGNIAAPWAALRRVGR